MGDMPFGVDLSNANFSTPPSGESSSEGSGGSPAGAENPAESPAGRAPSAEPREASSRFGSERATRELSREELETAFGEKPQQGGNEKFEANFHYDLATVLQDPSKLREFAQIYPREYTEKVQQILQHRGVPANTASQRPTSSDAPWKSDPEYQDALKELKNFKEAQRTSRVENINRELDRGFDSLSKKYPDADPNVVNWFLQGLAQKNVQLMNVDHNGVPTTVKMNILEKLFKSDHDQRNASYEKKYRSKVDSQRGVNRQAKDMGTGGSSSGAQASGPKNIKEATKAMLSNYDGRR